MTLYRKNMLREGRWTAFEKMETPGRPGFSSGCPSRDMRAGQDWDRDRQLAEYPKIRIHGIRCGGPPPGGWQVYHRRYPGKLVQNLRKRKERICCQEIYQGIGTEGIKSYAENGLSWTRDSGYISYELRNEIESVVGYIKKEIEGE